MKLLTSLLILTLSVGVSAQDTIEPVEATPGTNPTATPAELPPLPDPMSADEPSDLMRNQPGSRLRPAPEPSLIPGIPSRRPGASRPRDRSTLLPPKTSADLEARIRYRQAHSRAAHDATIRALWEESRVAKTDYAKREALRSYYTLLYKRMVSFDKSIAPLVEERRRLSLRRLDQTRIEPTDPMADEYRQRRE